MITKQIDLHRLARKQPNTVFDPKKMNCVIMRHRSIAKGRPVALIFNSGYISVNGCRTSMEARQSLRQFARIVAKSIAVSCKYSGRLSRISILAISATCRLSKHLELDMHLLAEKMGAMYEPELFTAATVRSAKGECFLVFRSGSIVVTGMKDDQESCGRVKEVINSIANKCCKHAASS